MNEQYELRYLVRLAKAKNEDIHYKDFADYLEITDHSFYNWLKGYYSLSRTKANKLKELVYDLAMD